MNLLKQTLFTQNGALAQNNEPKSQLTGVSDNFTTTKSYTKTLSLLISLNNAVNAGLLHMCNLGWLGNQTLPNLLLRLSSVPHPQRAQPQLQRSLSL